MEYYTWCADEDSSEETIQYIFTVTDGIGDQGSFFSVTDNTSGTFSISSEKRDNTVVEVFMINYDSGLPLSFANVDWTANHVP